MVQGGSLSPKAQVRARGPRTGPCRGRTGVSRALGELILPLHLRTMTATENKGPSETIRIRCFLRKPVTSSDAPSCLGLNIAGEVRCGMNSPYPSGGGSEDNYTNFAWACSKIQKDTYKLSTVIYLQRRELALCNLNNLILCQISHFTFAIKIYICIAYLSHTHCKNTS